MLFPVSGQIPFQLYYLKTADYFLSVNVWNPDFWLAQKLETGVDILPQTSKFYFRACVVLFTYLIFN